MVGRDERRMRSYWDERARLNAPFYVDTRLSFDDPDMEAFFATARKDVAFALGEAPVGSARSEVAVDIGCGLGRMCIALADHFRQVIGIDVSSEMLARAQDLIHDERISFVLGDGSSLAPLDDSSVDLVFSHNVFQHLVSGKLIERYIEEAGRVLRPGGVFILEWNNLAGAWRWRVRREVVRVLRHLGRFNDRYGRNDPSFLGTRVPLSHIRRAVERGGMELVKTADLGTLFAWGWAVKE